MAILLMLNITNLLNIAVLLISRGQLILSTSPRTVLAGGATRTTLLLDMAVQGMVVLGGMAVLGMAVQGMAVQGMAVQGMVVLGMAVLGLLGSSPP